jgi:RimJ/RimL family protein N-acetyltransferase
MAEFARISNVPGVAALYHSVWHETQAPFMPIEERSRRTLDFFIDRMTKLVATTIIEKWSVGIVGFAAWHEHLLGQIFIAIPYRGSGLGGGLLVAAESAMANSGTLEAELHCVIGNHRARRFYERANWVLKGEIQEEVAGPCGPIRVPFWCLTKRLRPYTIEPIA